MRCRLPFHWMSNLQKLAEIGFVLRPGISKENLLYSYPEEEYAKSPYDLILFVLGGTIEKEPFDRICDAVWCFDTEYVEDHGAYKYIAECMRDVAGGDLPIKDIEDYVNVEEGKAWVSFTLDGTPYKWDARIQDDWMDDTILTRFAELLKSRNTEKRYAIAPDGQSGVVICVTPAQLAALKTLQAKRGMLTFVWLK